MQIEYPLSLLIYIEYPFIPFITNAKLKACNLTINSSVNWNDQIQSGKLQKNQNQVFPTAF